MKKQIRQGVFETNSSSTHSMCIHPGSKYVPNMSKLEIKTGEFGWEEETYDRMADKLSYALTYALGGNSNKYIEMLNEVLTDNMPDTDITYNGMPYEELLEMDVYRDDVDFGYIDHQSLDEASEMFLSKNNLEDFIFGRDSYFITDNDNH